MTRFATARHLASWAGLCPGNDKSAGKRCSGKTRDGSKWLDFALEEAAMAAIRVKGHYLEAHYRRLKPRRGHKRALDAIKHTTSVYLQGIDNAEIIDTVHARRAQMIPVSPSQRL